MTADNFTAAIRYNEKLLAYYQNLSVCLSLCFIPRQTNVILIAVPMSVIATLHVLLVNLQLCNLLLQKSQKLLPLHIALQIPISVL